MTRKARISKKFKFDAAHKLPNYDGKCKNLHGHSWEFEVVLEGIVNEKTGMIIDFNILKQIVDGNVVQILDHSYLNDIISNPTAENILYWIWTQLEGVFHDNTYPIFLDKDKPRVIEIKIWETATSCTMLNEKELYASMGEVEEK